MRAASVLQGPQTLFVIEVTDGVSGSAIEGAQITMEMRPRSGEWAPFPFEARAAGAGRYVIGAPLRLLQTRVRTNVRTDFRVTVCASGYEDGVVTERIVRNDMRVDTSQTDVSGISVSRQNLRGAPFTISVVMSPPTVRLAGVIVRDGDLAAGVDGADVTLDGDAGTTITTDATGRFLFPALPLQRTVEVAASKGADSAARTHLIDYRKPTNRLTLNFKTAPTN